jgi:uncharacterized damage-inducible protein DinB
MKVAPMNLSSYPETRQNPKQSTPGLVTAGREVLSQGLQLLETCRENYSVVVNKPFSASIGQHYRHVVEHFQCLLEGATSGEVNYDSRKRDSRIENATSDAMAATREVISAMESWTESTLQERCTTISTVGYDAHVPSRLPSYLGRELSYCIGHAIHHYAIIRLLCSHLSVEIPAEFGFAPSTLKFRSQSEAAD